MERGITVMRLRRFVLVAAAAATIGIVPASVAAASSSSSGSTTIQLVAHQTASRMTSSGFQASENDTQSGKLIGYDTISCQPVSMSKLSCGVGLSLPKGMLFARFTISTTAGRFSGTIVGGTGAYSHSTGTVSGHGINSKTEAVTIVLH
jgi:hypothetical protein